MRSARPARAAGREQHVGARHGGVDPPVQAVHEAADAPAQAIWIRDRSPAVVDAGAERVRRLLRVHVSPRPQGEGVVAEAGGHELTGVGRLQRLLDLRRRAARRQQHRHARQGDGHRHQALRAASDHRRSGLDAVHRPA